MNIVANQMMPQAAPAPEPAPESAAMARTIASGRLDRVVVPGGGAPLPSIAPGTPSRGWWSHFLPPVHMYSGRPKSFEQLSNSVEIAVQQLSNSAQSPSSHI
jgi:hypothetical protein